MSTPNADRDLCSLGVAELGRLYRSRGLSPVEVTQATLRRIQRLNPELNAFLSVMDESALSAARAAELQFAANLDLGPLHGIPVSIKDIIRIKGTRTTAASRHLLEAPLDEEDATVVRRLRSAGAILVGKNNLNEFAWGAPDPEGPFGRVQNPRRVGHFPGGSSSGSGAAVAAGLGVISIGSDTGGSIRHPAAVNGVVGLKVTYGRVSVRGVIPLSVYLDSVGPMARSVADAAAGLAAIAGYDPGDPYSSREPVDDYLSALDRGVVGLRVGVPTNPMFDFGQPAALEAGQHARETLAGLGLHPVSLSLPRAGEMVDLCDRLMTSDLWVYHNRYSDKESLYSRDFLERALPARQYTAVQYSEARQAQGEIRDQWLALFDRVDLLVMPGNVAGAPHHDAATIDIGGKEYPTRLGTTPFNRLANFTGFPSLCLPAGETPEGMPIGIQLVGPPWAEARLLAVGHALEGALGNLTARWGIEPRRR